MQRREIIAASLLQRGALIKTRDMDEAIALANRIAPEHLELLVSEPELLIDRLNHAGAIFGGAYTAEAFGDYVAGPSHVLPTFGTARFASPLGVYDFVKRSSVIQMSAEGAAHLADIAVPLATGEGLHAHALAAAARAGNRNSGGGQSS
jgi:histidinol dehydrogenase